MTEAVSLCKDPCLAVGQRGRKVSPRWSQDEFGRGGRVRESLGAQSWRLLDGLDLEL